MQEISHLQTLRGRSWLQTMVNQGKHCASNTWQFGGVVQHHLFCPHQKQDYNVNYQLYFHIPLHDETLLSRHKHAEWRVACGFPSDLLRARKTCVKLGRNTHRRAAQNPFSGFSVTYSSMPHLSPPGLRSSSGCCGTPCQCPNADGPLLLGSYLPSSTVCSMRKTHSSTSPGWIPTPDLWQASSAMMFRSIRKEIGTRVPPKSTLCKL